MTKRPDKLNRIFMLASGILLQAGFCYAWLDVGGTKYSTIGYAVHVISSGDYSACMTRDLQLIGMAQDTSWSALAPSAYGFTAQIALLVLMQLAWAVGMVLALMNRYTVKPFVAGASASVATVLLYMITPIMSSDKVLTVWYMFFVMCAVAFVLLLERFICAWYEEEERIRETRQKEIEHQREMKERLRFEGRYSGRFLAIIWKNFRHNIRAYMILVSVSTLSASLIYAGFGLKEALAENISNENIILGQGIGTILMSFIMVTGAISAALIISILLFYLKTRVGSYGIFTTLGMRKTTLYFFIAGEIVSCLLVSIFAGLAVGTGLRIIFIRGIQSICGEYLAISGISAVPAILTAVIMALTYVVSVLLTHEVYVDSGAASSAKRTIEREKLPGGYARYLLIPGALLSMYGLSKWFTIIGFESNKSFAFFFVGVFILMFFGSAIVLRRLRRNEKRYYETLLDRNSYYYRFRTTVRYVFLFTLVNFAIMFIFGRGLLSAAVAEPAGEQFLYDYVLMATEDDYDLIDEIEDTGAEVLRFPMARMVNTDNTEASNNIGAPIYPQGQMICVSESTYERLCDEGNVDERLRELPELDAEGRRIAVVFQQDRSTNAHPLDYYASSRHPQLHVGQPQEFYEFNYRNVIFIPRDVASYRTGSVIGMLRQGKHENIVVVSNEYFETIKDLWKTTDITDGRPLEDEAIEDVNMHHWPDRLILVRAGDDGRRAERLAKIDGIADRFDERHAFDNRIDASVPSSYRTEELAKQRTVENAMKVVTNGMIIVILMIVSTIFIYTKKESETAEKQRLHMHLKCLGMSRKDRLKLLKKDRGTFLYVPVLLGDALSILFTVLMWRLRQYDAAACAEYMKLWVVLALVSFAVQLAGTRLFEALATRKIERDL